MSIGCVSGTFFHIGIGSLHENWRGVISLTRRAADVLVLFNNYMAALEKISEDCSLKAVQEEEMSHAVGLVQECCKLQSHGRFRSGIGSVTALLKVVIDLSEQFQLQIRFGTIGY